MSRWINTIFVILDSCYNMYSYNMYAYNMNVVVSSNTTPGKVIDKPGPALLRTESAANSKVHGRSLVVPDEVYDEDECMRKAIGTIEDVILETKSPSSARPDSMNGNANCVCLSNF